MKKLMIVASVVALVVMFSFPALALADECVAAPAVAGHLLEEAGIDNRYGTGRDGGNYIREVANYMGPGTDFNGVSKNDVLKYEYEVTMFLKGLGAGIPLPQNNLLSVVFDGVGDLFGQNVGDTMTFTFLGKIQKTGSISVFFSAGQNFWDGWGKTTYIISEDTLTVSVTQAWINPRPPLGASVTGFLGIADLEGNAVVVPAGGVPVTK